MWEVEEHKDRVVIYDDSSDFGDDVGLDIVGNLSHDGKLESARKIRDILNDHKPSFNEIIMRFFKKSLCLHNWIIYRPERIGLQNNNKVFATCTKCGKITSKEVK